MAQSPEEVLEILKGHGVTSLDDLAQVISKQTYAHDEFLKAMGREDETTSDYTWSGPNYSFHHIV